ncbi:hypothetical protein ONZ43_g263 [Nemania bipapillata]|uniref:Uncharacterized protein n=1 Tax=Nemania bipapillata TaxID=110536 RepID=A0ACC2J8Q7_9PEZI|nr:hypothetical protein ONZ43_g263 [Nemania bipapillata]
MSSLSWENSGWDRTEDPGNGENAEHSQKSDNFEDPEELDDSEYYLEYSMDDPITHIGTWEELSSYITAYTPYIFEIPNMNGKAWVKLHCEICHVKRINLPEWLDGPSDTVETFDPENFEHICVLPCNHFFGFECIQQWVKDQADLGKEPSCPKCRFSLVHPGCKHKVKLEPLPQLSSFDPYHVTRIVPFTRVWHNLDIPDSYEWDPKEADADHDFGVTSDCYNCEKERMLRNWEAERSKVLRWWK